MIKKIKMGKRRKNEYKNRERKKNTKGHRN
jgi:hypothetical protein